MRSGLATGSLRETHITKGRDDATIRALWGVEPAYLDASFTALAERHASIEDYAEEVLGIGPAQREALRANYLES